MVVERDFNWLLLILWDKKINLRFHSPAAKAWQVSRHTPTLVWSLTLSMMLLSSGKLLPTSLPSPLMFSNTDHMEGKGKKRHYQFDTPIHIQYFPPCYNTWYTSIGLGCPCSVLKHSLRADFASASVFLQAFHCSVFLSHQWHLGYASQKDCGLRHESQVMQHWCQVCSQFCKLKVTVCINAKVSLRSNFLYEMTTWLVFFPPYLMINPPE